MLGRYEYSDGSSNKYWEAAYNTRDKTYSVFWGRIGAKPQSQHGLGLGEIEKRAREKMAKGYSHVGRVMSCHEVGEDYFTDQPDRVKASFRVAEKREKRAEEKKEADDFMAALRKL